jgi:hypothetical protein
VNPPPLAQDTEATVELLPQIAASGEGAIVVVVKQRFRVTAASKVVRVPGAKVNVADVPWDEDAPERSSLRLPSDLCLAKLATDVLVAGAAIAPGRSPVRQLDVGVRVGPIQKVLRVFGSRAWYRGVVGLALSAPEPFEEVPLRWEHAWGGRDDSDPKKPLEEPRNPVGRGVTRDPATLVHQLGPAIEDPAHPIGGGRAPPAPVGVGPIGRHYMPRRKYAGTYDDAWRKTRMPLPPLDYDPRFEQAAPPDQIAPGYLRGGEPVALVNMSAEGPLSFELPRLAFFVGARLDGALVEHRNAMDTLVLFPGERAFEMTWRAAIPVPRRRRRLEAIQVHEKRVL